MGEAIDASFIILRVVLVLVCLVLQAILYGWGLNISHKAAYDTLLRLRTALQKRFEKLPLGVIEDKGTGTVKNCLWMTWTVWRFFWLTQCRRGSQI